MTLSSTPLRRARVARALFRRRVAVRFGTVVVAGVLLGSVPLPGARFAAWFGSLTVAPPILWAAVRSALLAENAELRRTLRPPRAAEPGTAAPPTQRSYRWLLLGQGVQIVIGWSFALGMLATMPFVALGAFGPDVLPQDLPNGAAWVIFPPLAIGVGAVSTLESRDWRRTRQRDVAGLPRGSTTVVGFGVSPPFEIFLVDGAVEIPSDPADADLHGVHAAPVGRLGDVRAGDVLVRTGPLTAGLPVHLSDGARGRWTGPLRVVERSELRPGETIDDVIRRNGVRSAAPGERNRNPPIGPAVGGRG